MNSLIKLLIFFGKQYYFDYFTILSKPIWQISKNFFSFSDIVEFILFVQACQGFFNRWGNLIAFLRKTKFSFKNILQKVKEKIYEIYYMIEDVFLKIYLVYCCFYVLTDYFNSVWTYKFDEQFGTNLHSLYNRVFHYDLEKKYISLENKMHSLQTNLIKKMETKFERAQMR